MLNEKAILYWRSSFSRKCFYREEVALRAPIMSFHSLDKDKDKESLDAIYHPLYIPRDNFNKYETGEIFSK